MNRVDVISRHLWVLLACLFVVMIGVGITMPVLPFYVERLALAEGVAQIDGDACWIADGRLGFVVGPALGAVLSRQEVHVTALPESLNVAAPRPVSGETKMRGTAAVSMLAGRIRELHQIGTGRVFCAAHDRAHYVSCAGRRRTVGPGLGAHRASMH